MNSKSLFRDLAGYIATALYAIGLFIVGVLIVALPRAIPNPLPETVIVYQSIGLTAIVAGLQKAIALLRYGEKSKEEKRYDEILRQLKLLETHHTTPAPHDDK